MSTAATTETKPAPPPVEKIKIKVDGREIEVPKLMRDWQGKLQPTTMLPYTDVVKRSPRVEPTVLPRNIEKAQKLLRDAGLL